METIVKKTVNIILGFFIPFLILSCSTLESKVDNIDNYKEVALSNIPEAIEHPGLYVVKLSPENTKKLKIWNGNLLQIVDTMFNIDNLIKDPAYERLSDRLGNSKNALIYI